MPVVHCLHIIFHFKLCFAVIFKYELKLEVLHFLLWLLMSSKDTVLHYINIFITAIKKSLRTIIYANGAQNDMTILTQEHIVTVITEIFKAV